MPQSLITFWNKYREGGAPYFHPDDAPVLSALGKNDVLSDNIKTFPDYATDHQFARRGSHRIDLSLRPVPYGGDLKNADIIILLLNPGLSYTDYYGEFNSQDYREALQKNLRQNLQGEDYPFIWLNPDFCWHEGFIWWEKKLRPILSYLAEQNYQGYYLKALQALSHRIGMIELLPYHSAKSPHERLVNNLPSVAAAKTYVQQTVWPKAKDNNKLLLVTRSNKKWGITQASKNVVIYDRNEAVGASLGLNSRGGNAILRHLRFLR